MIPPTILVADDHPLFREALKLAVSRAAPGAVILEAGQLGDAARIARDAGPLDLILLDLRMPGAEGFSGVAVMHAERPDTPILVVSSADELDAAPRARLWRNRFCAEDRRPWCAAKLGRACAFGRS